VDWREQAQNQGGEKTSEEFKGWAGRRAISEPEESTQKHFPLT
jgi:hypothetical protein